LRFRSLLFCAVFFFLFCATSLHAQTNNTFSVNIGLNGVNGIGQPDEIDNGIKILAVMTLLTLAPSIILLMTCFTRIVIVLSFVRSALSLQGAPSNQIIVGLSLFLTFFIMSPVWERIDHEALTPYRAHQITSAEAWTAALLAMAVFEVWGRTLVLAARRHQVEQRVPAAELA